jgi:hypothetical protein
MKLLIPILLLFLLVSNEISSQPKELKSKIIWDENKPLTWDNFKGPADKKSFFYAATSSAFTISTELKNQDELITSFRVFFDPKKSWKKKKYLSDELLKHEQNHFDITEVYARLLIKKLSAIQTNDPKKIIQAIKLEYSRSIADAKKKQTEYDKETNHGKLKEKQEQWNTKVKDMLSETKDFNLNSITFKIQIPVIKKTKHR